MTRQGESDSEKGLYLVERKSSRRDHMPSSSSPPIPAPTPTATATPGQPIRQGQKHLPHRILTAKEILNGISEAIVIVVLCRLWPTLFVKAFGQVDGVIRRDGGRGARVLTSRALQMIGFMARGTVAVVGRVFGIAVIAAAMVSRTMGSVGRRRRLGIIVEGELHAFAGRRRLACWARGVACHRRGRSWRS